MPHQSLSELQEKVGESKTVIEGMQIERGKVAEFARAIHSDEPIYFDEDAAKNAGYDAIPAPITFLRTSVFPRFRIDRFDRDPVFDLGFDKRREVHGEHELEFDRPVFVGDTLTGVATLVDVYQRPASDGGTLTCAVQAIEYTDTKDESIATERMTVIELPAATSDQDKTEESTR